MRVKSRKRWQITGYLYVSKPSLEGPNPRILNVRRAISGRCFGLVISEGPKTSHHECVLPSSQYRAVGLHSSFRRQPGSSIKILRKQ